MAASISSFWLSACATAWRAFRLLKGGQSQLKRSTVWPSIGQSSRITMSGSFAIVGIRSIEGESSRSTSLVRNAS
jgi:hypothetical protein